MLRIINIPKACERFKKYKEPMCIGISCWNLK